MMPKDEQRIPVNFEYTPTFPQILSHIRASLLISTYQAGKVLVLGTHEGKLSISWLEMEQPMGLAVSPTRIAIGSKRQIHFYSPAHETLRPDSPHDGCFVPRSSIYSGAIHGHDLGWGDEGLWAVNTLFSCLSTLHPNYSFVPQWRPPFISQLIDQDRCHLNGMAMDAGKPRFVTVLGQTDDPAGWRPNKASGGAILDVSTGRTVAQNLSMPHSPRRFNGSLYVLNSGLGQLCQVDPQSGRLSPVEQFPGYTRGLSFQGQFAFVGLSKIRETNVFGGLPIGENPESLKCGVGIVDLVSGKTVATFQFHSGVEEIFAVEVLSGFANPLIAGSSLDERQQEVWIVPSEQMARPSIPLSVPIYADEKRYLEGTRFDQPRPSLESDARHLYELARQHHAAGQWETAIDHFNRAAALASSPAPILIDLGNLYQELGKQDAARICYERAVEADPTSQPAQQNLGYLSFNLGLTDAATQTLDRLVSQQPSGLNRLLSASVTPIVYDCAADIQFWHDRSEQILNQAIEQGQQVDATETLVPTFFFTPYSGQNARHSMQQRGKIVRGKDFTNGRGAWSVAQNRPLRLGFLSAYFRDHTIGRLNIGRIEAAAPANVQRVAIQVGNSNDAMAKRFEKAADQYVVLPRDLQRALIELEKLELDMLLFTDIGMDSLSTTLAFSRFAPVQAATWGHPMTSGSPMIDHFVSHPLLEVANASEHYTERLLLLDSLGLNYARPQIDGFDPQQSSSFEGKSTFRSQLNLPTDRRLYGCPQTLFKFHPDFDEVLSGILQQDQRGEIVMIQGRVERWTDELRRRFRRTLPDAQHRVRFLPPVPNDQYLKLLAACDVLLDPYPFGGGNSTLESLAIAKPVVTLPSNFLCGRITYALLKQLDLSHCIATDASDYINKAVRIAGDAALQQQLAQQIAAQQSQLFDRPQDATLWLQQLINATHV